MTSLYKYLPSKYVDGVLDRGELLFRNLTYFRLLEGKVRGDRYEGIHEDFPDNDVILHNHSAGKSVQGRFAFLNSTDSDQIFVFCLSMKPDRDLMIEFSADACIEFTDQVELIKRARAALGRMVHIHNAGLLARPVEYYKTNRAALFDVTNPKDIAFAKKDDYQYQSEFRMAFGTRKGFGLVRQVVYPSYDPYTEALQKRPLDRMMRIGNVRDIARPISL